MELSLLWILYKLTFWPTLGCILIFLFLILPLGNLCKDRMNGRNIRASSLIPLGGASLFNVFLLVFIIWNIGFVFYPKVEEILSLFKKVENFKIVSLVFHAILTGMFFGLFLYFKGGLKEFWVWIKSNLHVTKYSLLWIIVTLAICDILVPIFIEFSGYFIGEGAVKEMPISGNLSKKYILFGIWLIIFAPILEEVFFRGILFEIFEIKYGIIYSVFLTSLVFGVLHGPFKIQFAIGLFLGLIFGSVRAFSRSLFPTILIHGLWNLIVIGPAIV